MNLLRTRQKHVLKYSSKTVCSKKPMKPHLPAFDPSIVETEWLEWWRHLSEKDKSVDETSTNEIICLPPPNVTGNLHIGHALTVAIQDSYARW
uniref:valine--tRNA ligase n=1 Tax=Romanomermis culicivorax TaxID=13658 RepID=A0A915I681_ROMCU